jgi:hypothetical protein
MTGQTGRIRSYLDFPLSLGKERRLRLFAGIAVLFEMLGHDAIVEEANDERTPSDSPAMPVEKCIGVQRLNAASTAS